MNNSCFFVFLHELWKALVHSSASLLSIKTKQCDHFFSSFLSKFYLYFYTYDTYYIHSLWFGWMELEAKNRKELKKKIKHTQYTRCRATIDSHYHSYNQTHSVQYYSTRYTWFMCSTISTKRSEHVCATATAASAASADCCWCKRTTKTHAKKKLNLINKWIK